MLLSELSFEDLQRLRKIVKRVHFRYYPKEFCTDYEADKQIEALGPAVVERLIKQAVDNRRFRSVIE